MIRAAGVTLIAACVLAAACSSDATLPDHCNIALATLSPNPATIDVGDTTHFTVVFNTLSCLPADANIATVRWSSDAPAVVSVDSLTGLVTAISTGSATISTRTPNTHVFLAGATVTVLAPRPAALTP